MAEILCLKCAHFAPALDPNIARAFLGGCKKLEAPFTLILPLEGVTECAAYEPGAQTHSRQAATAATGPAQAKAPARFSPLSGLE